MPGVPVTRQPVRLRCAAVAAVVAAIAACGQPQAEPDRLPDSLGGWNATSATAEFEGEDLFVYINGGAEIYHEYGFERLAVREYGRGDERAAVEIYTMAGSAYGIYSYARSSSGAPVSLGTGGTLADYYVHFWSGPHLVAVTARSVTGEARTAVQELAALVGAGFPDSGDVPRLMSVLPAQGSAPGSERYVVGSLGLSNAAPFAATLFRGFEEAAVSRFRSESGTEAVLVVLRWVDPVAATRAVSAARERAASTEGIHGELVEETGFRFFSDHDETMVGARDGALVRLAVSRDRDEPDLSRLFPVDNPEESHEPHTQTQ